MLIERIARKLLENCTRSQFFHFSRTFLIFLPWSMKEQNKNNEGSKVSFWCHRFWPSYLGDAFEDKICNGAWDGLRMATRWRVFKILQTGNNGFRNGTKFTLSPRPSPKTDDSPGNVWLRCDERWKRCHISLYTQSSGESKVTLLYQEPVEEDCVKR